MTTNTSTDFEKLKFDPFSKIEILLDNKNDPDWYYFNNDMPKNIDKPYLVPDEVNTLTKTQETNSFPLLYINIT